MFTELVSAIPVTNQQQSNSNKVYLSPMGNIKLGTKFIYLKGYILSVQFSQNILKGKIGMNKKFRQFLALSLIQDTIIKSYERSAKDKAAASLTIKIGLVFPPKEKLQIDDPNLINQFKKDFKNFYVAVDQVFTYNFNKTYYTLTIDRLLGAENSFVYLDDLTTIETVPDGDQKIRLKSTKDVKRNVFADNFSKDSLGIGGLDTQLTNLFRRAFASRRLPHSIVQKFGIKHVKGILLFGPPGTGKTLIARQLAKSLKAKSLQIVNGPQVFSKYVGQSQQNVRKLFEPARNDEKKYGDQSPIHVIVFDEIDAICRQRGSDGGSAGSKDAVVNQLLTNLDGVQALNNIIVIGMTNRKDLIDQAILRPGRLEVHIQIGIPTQQGRLQILKIHTKKLNEQKLLDKNVNLQQIAIQAKNYTGAQLEAVVKNASSYAMSKGNDIMDFSKKLQIKAGTTVDQHDFKKALSEVHPGFGLDQQNFNVFVRGDIINYGQRYDKILKLLNKVSTIHLSGSRQITSVLMHGQPGTGKTSIAAHFGLQSKFTYIKIISPQRYIGMNYMGKIYAINKIFSDAYKAKQSLIIIDNIQRLIQFVTATRDFNNAVLQSLLVLLKKIPNNPDCRLMIIGTISNYKVLQRLQIQKSFAIKIQTPLLNNTEVTKVLGYNLNVQSASIKQLVNFKDIVASKPKQKWSSEWKKYHS